MTPTILERIHNLISPQLPENNLGICGGVGGMSLFYALYSRIFDSEEDFIISQRILDNVCSIDGVQLGLKQGCLGLAFAIDTIIGCCKDSLPSRFHALKNYAVSKYIVENQIAPINYLRDDDLFSEGLYMCNSHKIGVGGDLEYYYMLERMIGEVDSCEYLLTCKLEGIYDASNISIINLCSIINYLKNMIDWKIYPYKSKRLLETAINKLKGKHAETQLEQVLKLCYSHYCQHFTPTLDIDTVSHAGFVSLIFGNPLIFSKTLESRPSVKYENCTQSQLLGIGIGYLSLLLRNYNFFNYTFLI